MKLKRYLYLWHRWLGVAMCLLFAMWFISGIVLMYVPYPGLSEEERLAGLPPLQASAVAVPPRQLLSEAGVTQLSLRSIGNRAVYVAGFSDGRTEQYYADTAEPVAAISAEEAVGLAQAFARRSGRLAAGDARVVSVASIDYDQWSLSSSLRQHRPLFRVDLGTEDGLQLYLSSKTGQVLRDTTRFERGWNWLGANLHWLYPAALRRHGELWAQLVITLSLLGLLSIVSGTVVGVWRVRLRKPYKGRSYSPYRGVMKWHHVLGLICVLFFATYMFSGLMSMSPWGIFSSGEPYSRQVQRYYGGGEIADEVASLPALQQVLSIGEYRELHWRRLGGEYYLLGSRSPRHTDLLRPRSWQHEWVITTKIADAAAQLLPDYGYRLEVLAEHDVYYYSHHQRYRPLPVLRLRFDDPQATWFHIDPLTGELRGRLNQRERLRRWLYNGLHSWDFLPLLNRRPLWDVLVITMMVLGAGFSITAIIIAVKRLQTRPGRRRA